MSTLLLRLAGPMQSWGTESKFDIRKTEREPSKSGVVGLLAAALGRKRNEPVDDLARLRFGVRVDREGILQKDFHMARGEKASYVTNRYYLADAIFLVGVESDDADFLNRLHEALNHPAFPLYLGRRSCPATLPLTLGIRKEGLRVALIGEPPLANLKKPNGMPARCRLVMDDDGCAHTGRLHDVPMSFDPENRRYGWRAVHIETVAVGVPEHDPMMELR